MALTGARSFVGFGFGAIQSGLFLYEAFHSGAFSRLVVAEVLPEVVATVRQADGHFTVNIAHSDRVEHAVVGPIEIDDPGSGPDRERLVDAVAEAEEIATAIPSVTFWIIVCSFLTSSAPGTSRASRVPNERRLSRLLASVHRTRCSGGMAP